MPVKPTVSKNPSSGVVLLITGLPAAGKTSLGRALTDRIENRFNRKVSLLDGDEVRKLLSSELGFSREHRRLNVLRHGYLAAEVCRHGGVAVCSLIAPYAADRAEMRQLVTHHGKFVEVYLSTPLTVCEQRDPKGLYARARAGKLEHMTGVNDPYEPPLKPELVLDGSKFTVEQLVEFVVKELGKRKLLRRPKA